MNDDDNSDSFGSLEDVTPTIRPLEDYLNYLIKFNIVVPNEPAIEQIIIPPKLEIATPQDELIEMIKKIKTKSVELKSEVQSSKKEHRDTTRSSEIKNAKLRL